MTSSNSNSITAGELPVRRSVFTRNAILAGAGLSLAALGVAAGLAWRPAPVEVGPLSAQEKLVQPASADVKTPTHTPPPAKHQTQRAPATTAANATPLSTQPAAVCTDCGVIEGVRAVEQKGQATGLGAVAGGVLGGAVGNQVGKGNGRTAMTVLGAIGGGLAGHEVEKRARSETVYDVRVRMDDGSVRTLRQTTAPQPGARVVVEGNTLRAARTQPSDGQMVRTSTGT